MLARIGSVDQATESQALVEFFDQENESLYHQAGKITLNLHSVIVSLDLGPEVPIAKSKDIRSSLGCVVRLTSQAANKTTDVTEETLPVA